MRIELTWPRSDADDRTLTVPVPDVPVADLLRRVQTCTPGVLRQALAYAEPVASSAAGAVGAGALVHLAVPFAVRLARQALAERE